MMLKVYVYEGTIGEKKFEQIEKWLKSQGREYGKDSSIGPTLIFMAEIDELEYLGLWEEAHNISINI